MNSISGRKSSTLTPALALLLAVATAWPVAAQDALRGTVQERVDLAIASGLHWLASTQITDGMAAGSWPSARYPTSVTGLAGLAFLASGHTPGSEHYGQVVEKALDYIKTTMTSDGYAGSIGDSMYVHAICTLFALSALGMQDDAERDAELAAWCQKAVDLIIEAQKVPKANVERGGWRYAPTTRESDLSVTSWMMLCLQAARQCGLTVEDSVINAAMSYVNSAYVELDDGRRGFIYRPGRDRIPEYGVTGTAILMKALFENQIDEKMVNSIEFLKSFEVGWGGAQYRGYFFVSTLYMLQGFFQMGGIDYDNYLLKLQKVLVDQQRGDGSWPFPPGSNAERIGVGPVYPTANAVLILAVDRQFLPVFQRQRSLFE